MTAAGTLRGLLASPRARLGAGAAAAAAALALALPASDLAAGAARGALAVAAIAAAAAIAARPRATALAAAPRLAVVERAALGRAGGVALLVADGRRLVVTFGDGAPRLLADLGAAAGPLPPGEEAP